MFLFRVTPLDHNFLHVRRFYQRDTINYSTPKVEIIRRFGHFKVVQPPKGRQSASGLYFEAIDATEQYHKILDVPRQLVMSDDSFFYIVILLSNLFRNHAYQQKCRLQDHRSHLRFLLDVFLRLTSAYAYRLGTCRALVNVPHDERRAVKCTCCSTHLQYDVPLQLGYLMYVCAGPLHRVIQDTEVSELKLMFPTGHIRMYQMQAMKNFKSLSSGEIQEGGSSYGQDVIAMFGETPCSHELHKCAMFMLGQMSVWTSRHISRKFLRASIVNCDDLYIRVQSMMLLSLMSDQDQEFQFACKLVKNAYKLSKGYMQPSIVNDGPVGMKIFKTTISMLTCDGCSSQSQDQRRKMRYCTGCFKTVYCSRKCQKKHWRSAHRQWCGGTRKAGYDMLKAAIFDRL